MNSDKNGSEASSGAASGTPPEKAPANLTESDFLARQVEQASQAMSTTLHEMANQMAKAADPRAWTQEHPWYSVGAAAILGFMAASALTPARGESFKERMERLFPESQEDEEETDGRRARTAEPKTRKKGSKLSGLSGHLVDAVKTALTSVISSSMATLAQQNAGAAPPTPSPSAPATDPTAPTS